MIHENPLLIAQQPGIHEPNLDNFADVKSAAFFYQLPFDPKTLDLLPFGAFGIGVRAVPFSLIPSLSPQALLSDDLKSFNASFNSAANEAAR